jgi:hypothetical protein
VAPSTLSVHLKELTHAGLIVPRLHSCGLQVQERWRGGVMDACQFLMLYFPDGPDDECTVSVPH